MTGVVLRSARADEAGALSELALRSKAHWGYSEEFLEACRAELTVAGESIGAGRVVVAVARDAVLGFSILAGEPPSGEIDMLFVEPAHIGSGVGERLFARLRGDAADAGFMRLRIESDPHAQGFYEHLGAIKVGDAPSGSIPGRTLPVLELDLESGERFTAAPISRCADAGLQTRSSSSMRIALPRRIL